MLNLPTAANMVGLKTRQLRDAIRRGDLKPIRMGKLIFVTESALREMQQRCRENASPRASTSTNGSGSSATARHSDELASAKAKLKLLSEGLPNTSPRSGTQIKPRSRAATHA